MGLKDGFEKKDTKQSEEDTSREEAFPVPNSNRSIWGGGKVRGLTPERLASILDQVRGGEIPSEYIEIAQELEQRDTHYRSVLSTRKHAVESLDQIVIPASDTDEDKEIAAAVEQDILSHPDLMDLIKNGLDALGKGFSVNEIVWDTSGPRWKPKSFLFRDPRWFAYDKDTGILRLRDLHGNGLIPLEQNKYIIHEPNLLSGPQITSGLSFTALFYWLIKNYDITSWAAFVDRFGYPVRLGKYGKKTTKEDINTLKRAVAAIGSDVGAVIPDSMIIDIIESKTTGPNAAVYKDLAEWVNKELSKLVLGQTASSEGTEGKLGESQTQEEVRQDIKKADAAQWDQTINRDLVIPYVKYNWPPREAYPKIKTVIVQPKNIQLIVDSIQKMVPLGLKVSKTEVLDLLGLSVPGEKDEVLEQPAYNGGMGIPAFNSTQGQHISLNASEIPAVGPGKENEYRDDFAEITDDMYAVLEAAADKATDYESFLTELNHLASDWPPEDIARLIAVATYKSRIDGNEDFTK